VSEISKTNITFQKSYMRMILPIAAVMILLLVYGAGIFVLPITILSAYQSKSCNFAFSLNGVYTSIYPAFIQDETLTGPIKECEAYTLAASNEEKESWHDAYDSYQAYSNTYPNGLYTAEAHERSAVVLMALARDQVSQNNYAEAITNLNLIFSNYSDTGVADEALTLTPSTYIAWGTGLRESMDFESAEQIFNEFKTWSQNNREPELATNAQSELAQTYLTWGLNFQSQKQFEPALAKLDMAISTDPDPASASGSATQAKAVQISTYIEWGNTFVEQKEFAAAIEKFERAVSLAGANNGDNAKDALTEGRIEWASALSKDEDFLGALEQLEVAKGTAVTESMKQTLDTAFGEVYLAFSNSSGGQARRAMKEAYIEVCDRNKKPDLPIFGLNQDSVRVGIYGVEAQLPESLAARTPGEMHFIACVEEEKHTVSTKDRMVLVQRTSRGNYYMWIMQFRVQLLWNINLQKTETAESVAEKPFTGKMPPPFPDSAEVTYIYGPPPDMAEMAKWFESVIK
jgi:tetratricopeptide (TPR) repeat protein